MPIPRRIVLTVTVEVGMLARPIFQLLMVAR